MSNINWEEAEKNAGGNFTPMADPGIYEAEVSEVQVRESKNSQGGTTHWLEIHFADGDVRYPKVSHAISRKNLNWCAYHFMNMLKEFGIPEEKAKQAIENCESKKNEKDVMSTYQATFERAAAKSPKIKIEVFEDDHLNPNTGRPYMRADFANKKIAFGRSAKKTETVSASSIMSEGEEIQMDELPFN